MSTGRFAKRDREKARQARAAAKRARRFGGRDGEGEGAEASAAATNSTTTSAQSQSDVLAALAALHEAYDAGQMSLEDFEAARAELVAQIQI